MDDTRLDHDFGCRFAADGTVISRSAFVADLLGARTDLFDLIVAGDRERLLYALTGREAVGTVFDLRCRDPHGRVRVLSVAIERVADEDVPSLQFDLHVRDVSDVRRLAAALNAHREVLDQIATNAPIATGLDAVARMVETLAPGTAVAVYLADADVLELAAAPSTPPAFVAAASRVAGVGLPVAGTIEPVAGGLAEIVDRLGLGFGWWRSVIDETGAQAGCIVLLAPTKRFLTADERLQLDEAARLVSVAAGTAQAARRAFDADARDVLTGLLHRGALLDALTLDRRNDHEGRLDSDIVVAMVAVTGVEAANGALGFAAGDTMLRATAERLRRVVRGRDLLARWSGTRFVVVGRARSGPDATDGFARRVSESAGTRVVVGGQALDPGIVVTVDRQHGGESAEQLLHRLDHSLVDRRLRAGSDQRVQSR
jgi:diguanylate cyclase (GGDEF)-like protein